MQGVRLFHYEINRSNLQGQHPWLVDIESKIIRGDACSRAAEQLANDGFSPDVIIAHPGWGESLFLKDIWPGAKLAIYCEFYYHSFGLDIGFDSEFHGVDRQRKALARIKNANNLLHIEQADMALSPTNWQADTYPPFFRDRISVIHEGIDTDCIKPNSRAAINLDNRLDLTKDDQVLTYVSRCLEPYRGFHVFMRTLPELLKKWKKLRVLIVGRDRVGYGSNPENGESWRFVLTNELRPKLSDSEWERVHFLGEIPHTHFLTLLNISTVHVYLTYPFVLSWSVLEAMSTGCAIVASDTGPVREFLVDGENALLTGFFDQADIAERISALLENKELRAELSVNARQTIVENYDLKRICLPKQLEWIQSVVN